MAELFVKNSLNSTIAVKFNVTLSEYVLTTSDGDVKWTLDIGTTYPSASGTPILPKIIHGISEEDINDEIEEAVSYMCTLINWETLESDNDAPYVLEQGPEGDTDINSIIKMIIDENTPSSGIDLSNIKVILNNEDVDFDITNEIEISGDPFQYTIIWEPWKRVYDVYS